MTQEHSFASPGPAGLAALAVVAFGFGASYLGKVPVEGLPILAAWLIGAGLVQFTTAIIELKDKNATGGNVMLFFAAFFMFASALSIISKFLMIINGITPSVVIEGWLWAAGAAFLTVITPVYAKQNAIMFFLVLFVDIILWMIVGIDTGWYGNPAVLKPIAGWCLIIVGVVGVYMSGAALVNTVYGKKVLPIPPPVIKG